MSALARIRNLARFLLLVVFLWASYGHAQVSDIEAYCLSQIPNNVSATVSPARVRNCVNYLTEHMSSVPYTGQVSTAFPIVGNFVNISGTVSATRFVGDGSALTGIAGGGGVTGTIVTGTVNSMARYSGTNTVSGTTGVTTDNAGSVSITGVFNAATVSSTFTNGNTASFTTYYGDGSHLSGIAAGTVSGSTVIDVRNAPYNVISDGAAHSGNLAGAQAALDYARTHSGTTVILAPAGVTTVYGTDTTVNLENPLKYVSNTDIVIAGRLLHNVNNGDNFILEGLNNALSCTSFQENVRLIGLPGNSIDTVSRTTSQSRKFIGMTCTKKFTVDGINVSPTTTNSSFACQVRHGENWVWQNSFCGVVPEFPSGTGNDAFHIHGNISGTAVVRNNTFIGDDDACSQTLEGSTMSRMTQKGVVFDGNYCSTSRTSALKLAIESSAVSATIFGTRWVNNYFTTHGPYGQTTGSNCFKLDLLGSSTRGQISDTLIANNVFDCPNGEAGSAAGPFGSIAGTTQQPQGIMNTRFVANVYSGYQRRGVELAFGADGITFDGGYATNYAGQREIISPSLITSMTYSSSGVVRIDFTPGVIFQSSTALISASAQYYVSITAVPAGVTTSNTGRFSITQVSDSFVLATATNVSSSSDVTATTISGSIIFRPGTFFYHRGAKNVTIRGMKIDDPPQFTQLTTESNAIPINAVYENNQLYNFWDSIGFQDSASLNARFQGNQCVESGGDRCMTESGSSSVSQSTFIMNRDSGVSRTTRGGFVLSDAEFREKWGNYSPAGSATSSTVVACPTGGLSLTSTCPTP